MNPFVEPFDGPLRFHVQSRSRSEIKHLVELDALRGNGKCTCEHFDMRFRKGLEEGDPPGENTRCVHIRDARDYFCDVMLERIARLTPVTQPPATDASNRYTFTGGDW